MYYVTSGLSDQTIIIFPNGAFKYLDKPLQLLFRDCPVAERK